MNKLGEIGEQKAQQYLKRKLYKIVATNYHSRFGEIDIIAENRKYIAFVEVKQRNSNTIAEPKEFVTNAKQQRIIATAELYLAQNPTKKQPRFDVIEVICDNNKIKSIKHLENAFTLV